ncbi:type II toxin-antitoxin system VapC family toxin [Silvanigrella sp.]|jgi:PIN domain nuclease of toxin-antitoxin system|uniref:type II toxin-antitoxin system VapC family toxin n=1 Tax=Silvanigrella sp. TaxID=2024976 RepID=UPI0037C52BF6
MKILLDTHILLWVLEDSKKLSKKAREIIDNASEVYISSVSAWEIMIKVQIGKLDIDLNNIQKIFRESNFIELSLKLEHILELKNLPDYHKDPFDRMLIAQALNEPLKLITADATVKKYSDIIELV